MKETSSTSRSHERWAHFRFSVIGPLLAAPASRGELQGQLQELAAKKWRHPISGEWVLFGLSTIERWYYKALRSKAGPVEALGMARPVVMDPTIDPAGFQSLVKEALESGGIRVIIARRDCLLATSKIKSYEQALKQEACLALAE